MPLYRSMLFVPGSHARAMEKARTLPADMLIFDLEDGVADAAKEEARARIAEALQSSDYGDKTLLVRINAAHTAAGKADIAALQGLPMAGRVLPKVEHAAQLDSIIGDLLIWANVETPPGVLNAAEIAAHPKCAGLIAGTNDLRAGLGLTHSSDRTALHYSLSALVLAARAYGKTVIDGTYIQFDDMDGLKRECEEGRMLGFDGKTLVHPTQIDTANEVFSPTEEEIEQANAIITQYEQTLAKGQSVDLLDGQMIEELHVRHAQRILQIQKKISDTGGLLS